MNCLRRSFLALTFAFLASTDAQAGSGNDRTQRVDLRGEDFDFEVRSLSNGLALFYAGPEWFRNTLPAFRARARSTRSLSFHRSGDRVTTEAAYVGTLSDLFDVSLFDNVLFFGGTSFSKNPGVTLAALAGSANWSATPTNGNWVPLISETNWLTGAGNYPGDTSGTTNNQDEATFSGASTITSITINSATLNVKSITFTGASAPAYTIGSTGGNSLFLTNGGAISVLSVTTGAGNADTVNAPLVLLPGSSTTAGTYTFSNNSGTASHPLIIGGTVTGGTTTQGITLTLTGSNTGANTVSGAISNGGATNGIALSKIGLGTWVLTGNNTYTGTTSVSAGTLTVSGAGANQALGGTTQITVSGTGTLLQTTSNEIKDNADMTLSGGTYRLNGGVSEGTGGPAGVPGLGSLTLTSNSIIDLSGTDLLHFANSSTIVDPTNIWTGTLSIWNWSGIPVSGGGSEQLLFGTDQLGLSPAQLAMIQFYSGPGTGAFTPGAVILSTGEIVPVPEPSTWIGASMALAAIGFTQRRRLRGLNRLRRSCLALTFAFLASTGAQAGSGNDRTQRVDVRGEDFDFEVRSLSNGLALFYAGPKWFRTALPASRARARSTRSLSFDRSGDRVITEAADVGTLSDLFDVSLFDNISFFVRPSSPKTFTPNIATVLSTIVWDGGGGGNEWMTNTNWAGDVIPDGTDVAQFGAAGPAMTIGISMNLVPLNNNGPNNQAVGAIELSNANFIPRTIRNSGTIFGGTLTLNGATVNAVSNVVLRNNSLSLLSLTNGTSQVMNVALNNPTDNVVNIGSFGGITISSVIKNGTLAPNANLTLNAPSTGALTFSGAAANTYSGLTAVNTGTLILNKTAGVNAIAGDIRIGNGTTGGTATARLGAANQFNDTSDVELAGGTLNLNGFSEGAAGTTGIGALTLTTTSTLDFGAGATSIIQFAGLGTQTDGQVLQIINWDGNPGDGDSGDRLLFAGNSSAFSTLYNQSEVSFNGVLGYTAVDFGSFYEITEVPERGTWIGGAMALAAIGFMQRRRLRGLSVRSA